MVKFSAPLKNYIFLQIYQNIDGFRQNNSQLKAFTLEFMDSYKQNPFEEFFIFIIP